MNTPVDRKQRRSRRRRVFGYLVVVTLSALVIVFGRPTWHVLWTTWHDVDAREALPPGMIDDASRLNRARVAEVWQVPSDPIEAERQLASLLARASRDGLHVSIAGARHSMGGHTIYPGGVVIDMTPFQGMQFDGEQDVLHVQAGAKWNAIIPYLDDRGKSVAVMQSNNSFTVGGSLSVNCHGWQFGKPPICSTVESIRVMKADGTIVRCGRDENAELFSLVVGGYGLFGVILDAELRVVPNQRYRIEQVVVPTVELQTSLDRIVDEHPDVEMIYARMCVVPDHFLEEAIISAFYRDPAPDGRIPALSAPGLVELRRSLFRGSAGSDYGKQLRWEAETRLQPPHLRQQHYSRNQLLNESAELFQNRSGESTDILHEYFVPRKNVAGFVAAMQRIIPRHDVDLLNVTVRDIDEDHDTFLRYATEPVISFVMLFNQRRAESAELAMRVVTRELVDAALAAGGRYYLPYRLHATPGQFRRAYPQANEFFALKRKYDPTELFQNQFYLAYAQE